MSVRMRLLTITVPLLFIVGGLIMFVSWSRQAERFPLKTIEVHANLKQIKEDAIQVAVAPFLQQGFFWLDVKAVQNSLKQVPWVQSAEVRRVWPDRLLISVQEQTAQARWNNKGILSTEGDIFYPSLDSIPTTLPRFLGSDERAKEMLQQYLTCLELLAPVGLTIQEVELAANGSWRILLGNDIAVILGKSALNERLNRFILAYQTGLKKESQRIAYIDLRYTNGVAVGWRTGV